jgi:hypothetical protein
MTWLSTFLLNPALFWFLPLAAIPIILHLLTLHRLKTVELSTYRFLFDSYVQQRRRTQFMEALLAMLRTLFLLFLVMVFCRPVVKNWGNLFFASSGREIVMLVDCSASMNARTGGVSSMERARMAAETVCKRLSPRDRLTLIRVASRPDEIYNQFTADPEAIQRKIESLKAGPSRANMFAAMLQVFGPEAPKRSNPLVYIFTDCQSSGWREVKNQGVERLLPPQTEVVVVNVGSDKPVPNLAVVGNAPSHHRAIVGLPVHLRPRVVNYSKTETAEVTVAVFMDDKEIARTPLVLKPGQNETAKIVYFPSEPGLHRGRFEIFSKSPDQFPDDNNFLFTLSVLPKVKVLLVNGNPAGEAFDSETLYLQTALSASREEATDDKKADKKAPSKDFLRSLDPQEIPEGSLNAESLQDASVVMLANCGNLNDQQYAWLRDFVHNGGGLLVLPGDKVNPDVYNTRFFQVPGIPHQQLTPVRFAPPQGELEKAETFERLASIDFAHPVLSVFDDPQAGYFQKARFYRRFPMTLPEKREGVWPLAEFTNGAPALAESKFGDGIALVAAFPANTKWTNLPAGGREFVPLVKRLVNYLKHRPELDGPSVVPADGVAEVAVTQTWAPVKGKVTDPSGITTQLDLERSGNRFLAAWEKTVDKGYYTVEIKSDRPEQAKTGTLSFAVNLAPEESDFGTLGEDQFQGLLAGAQLRLIDASAEAQQRAGALGKGDDEIYRYLIWFLFIIIVVEFLLATVSGARRDTEQPATVAERIRQISPGSWVARMTGAAAKGATE